MGISSGQNSNLTNVPQWRTVSMELIHHPISKQNPPYSQLIARTALMILDQESTTLVSSLPTKEITIPLLPVQKTRIPLSNPLVQKPGTLLPNPAATSSDKIKVHVPSINNALTLPNAVVEIPVPRSKIKVPLWIIIKEPREIRELWNDGKFKDSSFADLLEGVTKVTHRSHIEKIKFVLWTPVCRTIIPVDVVNTEAESVWINIKACFVDGLKEARGKVREQGIDGSSGYKIDIELFFKELITTSNSEEVDDYVFDL